MLPGHKPAHACFPPTCLSLPALYLPAEALARAQELLGTQLDVSAAGLIAESIKAGLGPAIDWSDFPQRQRQAEADAVVLSRLLQAASVGVAGQLAAAGREGEEARAEVAAARRQLAQQAESFRCASWLENAICSPGLHSHAGIGSQLLLCIISG